MTRKVTAPPKMQARRYPWDDWFHRDKPFTLRRIKDYNGYDTSFMQLLRHKALHVGARVSCLNPEYGIVVVTVIGPPGSRKPKKRVR